MVHSNAVSDNTNAVWDLRIGENNTVKLGLWKTQAYNLGNFFVE